MMSVTDKQDKLCETEGSQCNETFKEMNMKPKETVRTNSKILKQEMHSQSVWIKMSLFKTSSL